MRYKNQPEKKRNSSVSFAVGSSGSNREDSVREYDTLRESSGLSSGISEGYKSAYDRVSSSEGYGWNSSRHYEVNGYKGKGDRRGCDDFPYCQSRSLIQEKGRNENNRSRRYRNNYVDETYHDNENGGSRHHFTRRDGYDEEEYQKKRYDYQHGSRHKFMEYVECGGGSSSYARSATSPNSGRWSESSGRQSSEEPRDLGYLSAVTTGKYSSSAFSQRNSYSNSSQTDNRGYQETQPQRESIRPSQGPGYYTVSSQQQLRHKPQPSPYYVDTQVARSADRRNSLQGNYNNMAACNAIAAACRQSNKKPYEEAMRDLREENSDDENCYVAKRRMNDCPDHIYTCRTVDLPCPYDIGPDLSRAYVSYGEWNQVPQDPHCRNVGPCEDAMGVCPIITRIKKEDRLGYEDLPAHLYAQREGEVTIPPVVWNDKMSQNEYYGRVEDKRKNYYRALKGGGLVFAARCGRKRGSCEYAKDLGDNIVEEDAPDQSDYNISGGYNHPNEFISPDYPTCVVKQCKFQYKSPLDLGIPKKNFLMENQGACYIPTIARSSNVSSKSKGACACGNEKASGKRKHRCGFPTLHAEKNKRTPGVPFPHSRVWEDAPPISSTGDFRRSNDTSASMYKQERGSTSRSSVQGSSLTQSNGTVPRSVSLCADAACISSGICRVSGSDMRPAGMGGLLDGRSCSVSYSSCKELKRKISPQADRICCLPPLFSDYIPRFPLCCTRESEEVASSIMRSVVGKATGNIDESRRSASSYKKGSTLHGGAFSDMMRPWNHDTYTGWNPSYGCTAGDESCKYQSNNSSSSDRWPNYYGYLWNEMKTPVPRFQTCGRKFRTDYMTSNYTCPL